MPHRIPCSPLGFDHLYVIISVIHQRESRLGLLLCLYISMKHSKWGLWALSESSIIRVVMSRRILLINLFIIYYRHRQIFLYWANFKSGKLSSRSRILPVWACSFPDVGSLYQQIISLSCQPRQSPQLGPTKHFTTAHVINHLLKRCVTFTLDPVLMERFALRVCTGKHHYKASKLRMSADPH